MGVRDYRDFDAWKLAADARRVVFEITDGARWTSHLWLRDQMRRAASSSCANFAEGFARYHPRDFARFLGIAKSSLYELLEHLAVAEQLGLLTSADASSVRRTILRANGAISRLIRYLVSATPPKPVAPAGPMEPMEPVEPVEPMEPVEPVEPMEPMEPTE